jgi:hypothetical protein
MTDEFRQVESQEREVRWGEIWTEVRVNVS